MIIRRTRRSDIGQFRLGKYTITVHGIAVGPLLLLSLLSCEEAVFSRHARALLTILRKYDLKNF